MTVSKTNPIPHVLFETIVDITNPLLHCCSYTANLKYVRNILIHFASNVCNLFGMQKGEIEEEEPPRKYQEGLEMGKSGKEAIYLAHASRCQKT